MKGILLALLKDDILPPLLLAGVLIRLDGVLNSDDVDDDVAMVLVDGVAAFAVPLLYDPPGVFCSCCARVFFFDWLCS